MEANKHRRLFSQRLRGLMNRHQPDRMTLEQLASRMTEEMPARAEPYSKGWVAHKLSGKQDVTLDELHALATIFNTTVSYLTGESDVEERPGSYLDDENLTLEDKAHITGIIASRRFRRVQERQSRGMSDDRLDP